MITRSRSRLFLVGVVFQSGLWASASTLDLTSGLNLWLRADDLVVTGGVVDQWNDLSSGGIGDNVAQSALLTDGSPSLVGSAVNGRPSVNYGGGGGHTFTGSIGVSGTQGFTAFTVFKNESGSANGADERIMQIGDITDNNVGRNVALDGNSPAFRYNNGNRIFNENFVKNTFQVGRWSRAAGSNYGDANLAIDGQTATQLSAGSPGGTANLVDEGYTLGRGTVSSGGAAGNFLIGELAEMLLFDRELNPEEAAQVEFYLRHRYSLGFQAVDVAGVTLISDRASAAPTVASTAEGQHESNRDAYFFLEAANLTLGSNLNLNLEGPGTYTSGFDAVADTVAAGTAVNSYFVGMDTINTTTIVTNSFVFEQRILGVITGNNTMIAADGIVGNGGIIYQGANAGLENNASDAVIIGADGKSLTVEMRVGTGFVDQLRVITAAVPEPSAVALLGLGTAGLVLLRRRR